MTPVGLVLPSGRFVFDPDAVIAALHEPSTGEVECDHHFADC